MKPTPRPEWGAAHYLVWVDIETTGLEPASNDIIEVGLQVTEGAPEFEPIDMVSVLVKPTNIQYMTDSRHKWDKIVPDFHLGDRGLLEMANETGMGQHEAAHWLRGWVAAVCGDPANYGHGPMCGSSVGFDREFLVRYMRPLVESVWTYRNFDVSTLRELMSQLHEPQIVTALMDAANDDQKHRALPDLDTSISRARRLVALSQCGGNMAMVADLLEKYSQHAQACRIRDEMKARK